MNDNQRNFICEKYQNEAQRIDELWFQMCEQHQHPLKLIILAEAPLSYDKYFYNVQANFLKSLQVFWRLESVKDLIPRMIVEGVLLMDIYQFPLPSKFYVDDRKNIMYDPEYLEKKIKFLTDNNLLSDDTRFVFRYKNLINRNLHQRQNLIDLNYLSDYNNTPISMNLKERPVQILNQIVGDYLG
jgi:hypothetical protein